MQGVKFTIDENDNVFFVFFDCNNYFQDEAKHYKGKSYYSTDCVVASITNANTGEQLDKINGKAFHKRQYTKGEHITGERVFFCLSINDLEELNLITHLAGRIYSPCQHCYIETLERFLVAQRKAWETPFYFFLPRDEQNDIINDLM